MSTPNSIEEETERREGKGRRCCLRDEIHSIPCRTTDLAPGQFEEKDEQKNGCLAEWMLQKKWMIIWFTPHQTFHSPKMDVLPKTFLHIILAANWLVRDSSTVRPPNISDDLCLLFCLNLRLCLIHTHLLVPSCRGTKFAKTDSNLHSEDPYTQPGTTRNSYCR